LYINNIAPGATTDVTGLKKLTSLVKINGTALGFNLSKTYFWMLYGTEVMC